MSGAFTAAGRFPESGDVFRLPALADTLETLQPTAAATPALERIPASAPLTEALQAPGTRILELDVDLDRDQLIAHLDTLSPSTEHRVRLARPGEAALGPALHARATPVELLTVTLRPGGVLDAWMAVDDAGNGARLGPALACTTRSKRLALLEGLAGIAPWRDFAEVSQGRILLTPDQGSSVIEVLLPILPGARDGYTLVPVEELPPPDCITPTIDVVRG